MRGSFIPPFTPDHPNATSPERVIRIIDGSYNLQFTVQDGHEIIVDGYIHQLFYVDETHFRIGRQYFHICQSGEQTIDQGRDVRPA